MEVRHGSLKSVSKTGFRSKGPSCTESLGKYDLQLAAADRAFVGQNGPMHIALGSDHAGFLLKAKLIDYLQAQGHEISDFGTDSTEPVDYPPFCAAVGRSVVEGSTDWGIVLGGSGQGEQLAANKVRGVRAALCNTLFTARLARAHNDANVMAIGGRVVGEDLALEIVDLFATTEFEGGRHQRRIDQVMALENER